ncbi:MAG: outer membrane protein assembly factor BamE [Burkholderiales bacterium]|jgi:outer membrane protein assembly factor BamE|nr:outer membrane protein assembly factor BamE [Burkholderiales bacterium]
MLHPTPKTALLLQYQRMGLNALALLAVLFLWSCGYSPVKIYQPEVVQGNFVSKEQVQALRAGMPRQAVRDILGTPLVTSVFHAERWDYAFTIRRQGSEPQLRRFTVYFKGDLLDRVDGDPLPTEAEFAAKLDTRRSPSKLPPLKASQEELSKLPAKSTSATSTANASSAAPPSSYPPLESNAR